MRTYTRHLIIKLIGLLAAALLAGCYEVHQGRYVAERVSGWSSRDEMDGGVLFRYPTKTTPDWFVQIRGAKVGTVHLCIGSDADDPSVIWKLEMAFSGEPIRIIFHDGSKEAIVPVDSFKTPLGQDVQVGSSQDFTLVVPSFKIGDNDVPELSAHVRWSSDRYRVWRPLQ
jgi:hypothetical protein